MNEKTMKALGLDDPSKAVTAGELMNYMEGVIMRERVRLARIFSEYGRAKPGDLAELIADDRDNDVLAWD